MKQYLIDDLVVKLVNDLEDSEKQNKRSRDIIKSTLEKYFEDILLEIWCVDDIMEIAFELGWKNITKVQVIEILSEISKLDWINDEIIRREINKYFVNCVVHDEVLTNKQIRY
jgi:hypothetical protein